MFGKLKEKLKGWFSSSKEKVEEVSEVVETEEEVIEKADKIIEKAKKEKSQEIPTEFETGTLKVEPDIEKIKEDIKEKIKEIPQEEPESVKYAQEEIRETQKKAEEIQKEIERIEKNLEEKKQGILSRIKSTFAYKISEDGFNEIFDDLEMLLLENNVALEVVENIRSKLAEKLIGREINKNEIENEIKKELKKILNEILIEPDNPLDIIKEKKEKPFVILFFGINGVGKTTAIAKVAYFLKKAGMSVCLAAGDTFRAASIEQIAEHAKKLQIPLIKHDYNADPSAVGFDAIKYAKNHKIDVVLIDTAGRMHTKTNLIEEMKKIERVTKPDLKVFVAESIAGNDAVEQAKTFNEAIEIDGSILSKADIDEKGGTIISVSYATSKPIFYLGTGQDYKDLELFNKQKFIEELVG